MQVIKLNYPDAANQIPADPIVLALGFFDGVHRGHQQVVQAARQEALAQKAKLAVMTFDQHPSVVFQQRDPQQVRYLTTVDEKAELMAEMGVDILYVLHFDAEVGAMPPQTFVDQLIVGLHTQTVVAGFDYTYGPADVANMQKLAIYGRGRFNIIEVPKAVDGREKISSTRIRQAVDAGAIDDANELLGYQYETQGTIVHGEARGRTIGFPTANVAHSNNTRVPGIGIYATMVEVNGTWIPGMASVGRNVTFGDHRPITVEINLLDFKGDIYGTHVKVRWCHRMRGEIKFDGAAGLVEQLKQDEQATRAYFATQPFQATPRLQVMLTTQEVEED
ncbi:riboflavin biosynthesis protein RibF [Lactobacillus pentosus] [Lactiplantibacillus mudanjiangensis]|uniref:riboflavin biosynthesis protein RibF n=1 Tax=Lactiplantibacillus mudanjiangensis TaxID=1296538 RepID=UPI0010147840|nr:riboflavin biosynthesis protein RibF [Lactiplantibacillus mudanjiangensis]VDG20574.1 riboflavin biosynthesis protein RibF [Lactobacillus pentosus] [Lactiplantibacillus mudanjiangensis]VDG30688.1 riboflavin biosynthesis protein RibF [Lactobacillus pentosus] [Lactiplantibacillus mudanjiangensis]